MYEATVCTDCYEIRRTLLVRPEEFDLERGSLLGTYTTTLSDAIRRAESSTRLGYPARVVRVVALVGRVT